MPTIIDSLVIEFGLDASKFTEGQKKVTDSIAKFEQDATKHVKPVQTSFDQLVGSFREIQGRLLAIGAIIAAGLGFNRLTQEVTKANTELGYLSKTLGMTAQDLSAWQQAGRVVGASADEMKASIAGVNSQMQEFRATGTSSLFTMMGQLGLKFNPTDANANLMELSRYYASAPDKAFAAHLMKTRGGLSQGMINLLAQGPERVQQELAKGKALSPTGDEIKKFQDLTKAWGDLLNVIDRLTQQAILPFITAMTKLLNLLTDWLTKWATSKENAPDAAADALNRMGMKEMSGSKPGLFSRGWSWLRGKMGMAPNGGGEQGAANDNSTGSADLSGGGAAYLREQRAPYARELQDPETRRLAKAIISAENAGAGPAVLESLMNRTTLVNQARAQRGLPPLTLKDMMLGHPSIGGGKSFYGPVRSGAILDHLGRVDRDPRYSARMESYVAQALGGSNTIAMHTDQGSAGDPNYYAGGVGVNINGERFNNWGYPGSASFQQWQQRKYLEAEAASKAGVATADKSAPSPPSWVGGAAANVGAGKGFGDMKGDKANGSTIRPGGSFNDMWNNRIGIGAKGALMRGGDNSTTNNSNATTNIHSLNVTVPRGADPSAYADGIQRRLSDFNNVQNANTGLV